ncbi:tigger transposable element-derived protein 6-like [Sitophilus oryzae]|uniref:Tigger transposable element-derived protein 6-like n=1 Tax=Sitophilus oryzae TaxID=7048 RepID=A0A6J2Y6D6_SITOR|nr:tigger transposable element-derived protein 6-like [Sitophilus oryzae]
MTERAKYVKWSEQNMNEALIAFQNGAAVLNEIARRYKVPKATLKRRIDDTNMNVHGSEKKFGRAADLPPELEEEIVTHALELERRLFGIIRSDLRKLAYDVAEANGIRHRLKNGQAGKKWYYCFMSRHKELSLRQPEPTSSVRALGFTKEKVKLFFGCLTALFDKHYFGPSEIYNVDETGLSTVQRPQKIIGRKGKHQIGSLTSGERGVNTTCVCCFNAAGMYIPPMLIFKRIRFKDELKEGAPPGTIFACSESGWITSELFVNWLKHFINSVKPSKNKNVLLIMDGHTTHTKNLEAITLARENGIIMMSLPAHTIHRMQPCDISFFKPLSSYYNQAADKWLRANHSQNITQFQVSRLLGEAYAKAASVGNAVSGFAKCGIWPLDPNVFDDNEFVSLPSDNMDCINTPKDQIEPKTQAVAQEVSTSVNSRLEIPSTSTLEESVEAECSTSSLQKFKSVSEISPMPVLPSVTSNGTTLLTSTPYRNRQVNLTTKIVFALFVYIHFHSPIQGKNGFDAPHVKNGLT